MALGTSASGYVDFVSGSPAYPRLEIAPLDVGPVLLERRLEQAHRDPHQRDDPGVARRSASACRPAPSTRLDVGSPFDYPSTTRSCTARCTCPTRGRRSTRRLRCTTSSTALITAAGGRTLALFTSWKAMDAAAAAVRERVDVRRSSPSATCRRPALIKRVRRRTRRRACSRPPGSSRASTSPGDTLSLVVIDRIPFPRPGRPVAVGPPRAARPSGVRPDRPPARGDAAGPGGRTTDPHGDRPRRRRRARPPPRQRRATDGGSSTRFRRCAAPGTAPTPRRSSPRSSVPQRSEPGLPPRSRLIATTVGRDDSSVRSDELVHVDVSDRVATITLDSPRNRNALSLQLVADLHTALDGAEAGSPTGRSVPSCSPTPPRRSAPGPTSRRVRPVAPSTRGRWSVRSSG